ncbi:MAG: hypothetical protein PHV37_08305 [Candidatus Gastranaerophilales bacterium]|nr:hypothetical protein [Candidatus Gastranaerophilales bacterium]
MQLFEIKNDIAKILYSPSENNLLLADFLLIEDSNQSLIAQIINIESAEKDDSNIATIKFSLSINKNANLSTYNGYTPSKNANIIYIEASEIAQLIQSSNGNMYWGNLASHPDTAINLGFSLLKERPYIQCDKIENAAVLTTNILYGLLESHKKTLVIDFDGRYKKLENANILSVSKEYKLPLNFKAFNYIAENDLYDCSTENKAIIEGILLELQSYVSTLEDGFIPFDLFKSVIDEQCRQNPLPELIIFKNKLIKYQQKGLFAQSKEQFDFINKIISKNSITVIDASQIDKKWHKFILELIASQINKKCYMIFDVTNKNSDEEILFSIYENEAIRPIPVSSFKYDNIFKLKSLCKNLILFAPIEKTNDFEIYNTFLNKLNQKEFIIWSENTFYMPLILKLKAYNRAVFKDTVTEAIKNDIDKMLTVETPEEQTNKIVEKQPEEIIDLVPEIMSEEPANIVEIKDDVELNQEDVIPIEAPSENLIEAEDTALDEELEPQKEILPQLQIADAEPNIEPEPEIDIHQDGTIEIVEQTEPVENIEVEKNITTTDIIEDELTEDDLDLLEELDEVTPPQKTTPTEQFQEKSNETVQTDEAMEPEISVIVEDTESEIHLEEPHQTQEIIEFQNDAVLQEETKQPSIEPQAIKESTVKEAPESVKTPVSTAEPIITTPPEPVPIKKTPTVPVIEAKIEESNSQATEFHEGNFVFHAKYGKGVVEKIIKYGNKTLCSIQFENVGRRLLDPKLADIKLA